MAAQIKLANGRWLAAAILVLSGCETLRVGHPLTIAPSDIITDGGSSNRANTSTEGPSPPLALRWDYDTEGGFGSASPLIAGGYVIVASRAGNIDVIELNSGGKVGRTSLGEAIEGAPVLVDGRLLVVPVAAGKNGLVAYNLATGSKTWVLRGNWHAAGLLLAGETLVAAALDGTVRGIEPLTGAEMWSARFDSTRAFYAGPTEMANGLVAIADEAGGIIALNPATGAIVWKREIGLPVMQTAASFDGRLFVPTTQGQMVVLDTTTGETAWTYQADTELVRFASPAVDRRCLIVGATDGIVRCLDPASGEVRWRRRFNGNISAAPLLAGDFVYVGTLNERIAALDVTTGEVVWEEELPGRVKSAMTARNEILIVLSEPNFVHAFDGQHSAANTLEN